MIQNQEKLHDEEIFFQKCPSHVFTARWQDITLSMCSQPIQESIAFQEHARRHEP